MSEPPTARAERAPGRQQQQPQAMPSSGVGADSAMEVLRKKRLPLPGTEPPRAGDERRQPKPR